MRIFANCQEAISEIQRDLYEMGVEVTSNSMQNKVVKGDDGFTTKELQGYSFTILDSGDKDSIANNLEWCEAEFKERINGWYAVDDFRQPYTPLNPGNAYKIRSEIWNQFLVDGKFCYTYNERMHWQIKAVIEELKRNPNSRQAIIEVHSRKTDQDRMGGKSRIPCSMYYQFMIRNGKLDVIYNMRSTDFLTHFKHDIWLACKLRDFMAEKVGIESGKYIMFASSLHAYKKDFPEGVF